MKKVYLCYFCTFLIITFLVSGCTNLMNAPFGQEDDEGGKMEKHLFDRFQNTNGSQIDAVFEEIIKDIMNHDADSLKCMFSQRVVAQSDNIDQKIKKLIDFIDGDFVSYQRYGPGTYTSKDGNTYRKEIEASFDLETTTSFYKISLKICEVDTNNSENVGICSLFIVRSQKTDSSVFWGNDDTKIGIIIVE